jgi:hypothetical protein
MKWWSGKMKINWHPNPFLTKIELDEQDKKNLLNAYKVDQYEELLCGLDLRLDGKIKKDEPITLEIVKKEVDKWGAICNMDVDSEDFTRVLSFVDDIHMGDCTCVPCSCTRCYAEDLLGVNTLPIGKHQANQVLGAFGKDGNKTIDEALAVLEADKEYIKPDTWPDSVGYEIHIPRWESERKSAAEWLRKYKEEHGF